MSILDKNLYHKNTLFTQSGLKTILFYNVWTDIYSKWEQEGIINFSSKGIPSLEEFISLVEFYSSDMGVSVIFDDLGGEIMKNLIFFEHIFVVLSHHLKITIFLVIHNLFEKGLRKISLNSSRIILTSNLRDTSQISHISRQSF